MWVNGLCPHGGLVYEPIESAKLNSMKKFNFLVAAALMLFASCKKQDDGGLATVRLHVNEFEISQEEIPTKSDPVGDYNGINAITLAFYSGSTEVTRITQLRADSTTFTTFGDFECSLPMGSYTMVVIAYTTRDGSPFVLTSSTQAAYTGAHAYETFVNTQTVNVTNTDDLALSATLNRIVPKLMVVSTDGKTANAANVRMTLSAGSRSFNPITGLATDNNGLVNTVGISAEVGTTSNSQTCMFLFADEQTMTVTLDVLDANGESISHKVVENVPFQRNHVTKLTGSLYTAGAGSNFLIETGWGTQFNVNF